MTNDYSPISCAAHDQIEVFAMRRAQVEVRIRDEAGLEQCLKGLAVNTAVHDGAEFLVLEIAGERIQVRLDRLVDIRS